ncbi:DsbA family oxidoreductase [Polaromonas sp. YR568]|uniref:DsbA family oxidoreductase n=1 Tax=Polaromonas sp. YR568 TaxID=1855301 RepID=UPI003137F7BA
MVKVQVWSDFVCPFCMIAEQPLLEAVEAFGQPVDIEWMPFELRPYPTPTLRPEDSYLQTVWPQSVYPVAERFGVQLRLPSVSPQPYTAMAWQGYQFARAEGKGHVYNDAVLRAFFQEDRDIGRVDVLVDIAREVGLDPVGFEAALRDGRFREIHEQALAMARAQGVSGVPAFRIGPHWLPGVQPARTLELALRNAAQTS